MRRGVVLLVALLACGRAEAPPTAAEHEDDAARPTTPAPAATVEIKFDEARSRYALSGTEPVALALALPEAGRDPSTWTRLKARNSDGRRVQISNFATRYPDATASLYLDERGRPCFGVFRAPRPGAPAHVQRELQEPRLSLVGVESITVRTTADPIEPDEASNETIRIVVDGGEARVLSAAELHTIGAIDSDPVPGSRRQERPYWKLPELIEHTQPLATVASVRVIAPEQVLEISASELTTPHHDYLVGHNRRGSVVLRAERPNQPQLKLRGVERFEVSLKRRDAKHVRP